MMKYYHATFERVLPSILENGLGGDGAEKRWSFSNDVVCMGSDPTTAKKYANDVGGFSGEPFVMLEITGLDQSKVVQDRNSTNEKSFEYAGVIPVSQLKIIEVFFQTYH